MRTIERSLAFKRDFKRAKETPRHKKDLDSLVSTILTLLVSDQVLPKSSRDHALSGATAGLRGSHSQTTVAPGFQARRDLRSPGTRRTWTWTSGATRMSLPEFKMYKLQGSHSELFGYPPEVYFLSPNAKTRASHVLT